MDVREKLAELLKEIVAIQECGFGDPRPTYETVASYLISHGVTVQEWIPSSKRAPTEQDADRNGCVLVRTIVNTNTTTDFKHVRNDSEFYPYWMPLPEPPKGE